MNVYLICFGVGLGFIVLSFFVGEIFDIGLDTDGFSLGAFLQPMLIAIFLVVMGGLGLILTPRLSGLSGLVIFISALSGLTVAGLIHRFVIIPMKRAQNTSAFHIQDTVGMIAEVVSPIPQNGYGKIRYNISGSYVTSPAKSEDGDSVMRGEKVEIIYIEKNTYYVRKNKEN